ncbi:MAG: hypothetical protein DMF37_07280 [Verrucomicrobia bacterium]|nr:MAG: hypothetical protein DMF37_07280 [Verrucomicrobiota bacterium]
MRARNLLLVIAAGLASAAFAYLGTRLHPIWWLLWLAPVPVLAVAPRLHVGAAFLLSSVAWLIGEMNQWNFSASTFRASVPPHDECIYTHDELHVIFGCGGKGREGASGGRLLCVGPAGYDR